MRTGEKRVYYTLFSAFLVFVAWYAFYSPSVLPSVWSIILCFIIAGVMCWAVNGMRKETNERIIRELGE